LLENASWLLARDDNRGAEKKQISAADHDFVSLRPWLSMTLSIIRTYTPSKLCLPTWVIANACLSMYSLKLSATCM